MAIRLFERPTANFTTKKSNEKTSDEKFTNTESVTTKTAAPYPLEEKDEISVLENKIKSLKNNIESRKQRIQDIKNQPKTQNWEILTHKKIITALSDKIGELEEEIENIKEKGKPKTPPKLVEKSKEISRLEGEIKKIHTKIKETRDQISSKNRNELNSSYKEKINGLESSLQEKQEKIANLRSEKSPKTSPITKKEVKTHSAIKSEKPAKKKRGVSFSDEVKDINLSDRRGEYIHNRTKRDISDIVINPDLEKLTLKENQAKLKAIITIQKEKIHAKKTNIAELQIELEDEKLTPAEKRRKTAKIQELESYITDYKESLKELQDVNYLNVVNNWNEAHTKTFQPVKASDTTVKVEDESKRKPHKDIATTKDLAKEKVNVAPESNDTQFQTRDSVILGISIAVGVIASSFSPMIGITSGTITYGVLKYIDSSQENSEQKKKVDDKSKERSPAVTITQFTEREAERKEEKARNTTSEIAF